MAAKLIAIFRKTFVIGWLPSQRSAYFLAMVHLARWDTICGIERLEILFTTMTSTSIKKRFIRNLFIHWKYVEWYFKRMELCIIETLHIMLDNKDRMLPLFKKIEWNHRLLRLKQF